MVQLRREDQEVVQGEIVSDESVHSCDCETCVQARAAEAGDSSEERADENEVRESSDSHPTDQEPQTEGSEDDTKDELEDAKLTRNEGWATHARM